MAFDLKIHPASACLLLLVLGLCGCQSVPSQMPQPALPQIDAKAYLSLEASGVQIYRCDQGADHTPHWQLIQPSAKLTNAQGVSVQHGAGPSWVAEDGSRVTGKVLVSRPSTGNIDWLQLVAHNDGPPGLLSQTTYIERVNTKGGAANPAMCNATNVGQTVKVPYTATYVFYRGR
jgi:hypothetical protein